MVALLLAVALRGAEQPAAKPPAKPAASDTDPLYEVGKQLFDQYAPPDVKAQYDFPTKEQWDNALPQFEAALQSDSFEGLAKYAPQARAVLSTLRSSGLDDELADWLQERLDEMEAAQQAAALPPVRPSPTRPPAPVPPGTVRPPPPPPALAARIPYYDLWMARVKTRPVPSRAAELMPTLRSAFAAEGVPPSLAWVAEAESSLNPGARSPSGAKGLFQLTPDTAHRFGLGTFLPDERTNPQKSARAAAKYLRQLHDKFGDWPLALAAYNAGEGRVSRALASRGAKDFAGIASTLPAETRMYVPKVCALVAVRTGRPLLEP